MGALLNDWYEPYAEYGVVVEEVRDLGSGVVFSVNRQTARLRDSSGSVELHDAYVLIFEGGVVVNWTPYREIDEGCAAAERLTESRG